MSEKNANRISQLWTKYRSNMKKWGNKDINVNKRETQQIRWTKEHLQIENAHKKFELHDIYSKYKQLIYGIYVIVK